MLAKSSRVICNQGGWSQSCVGRCGENDSSQSCQCNTSCENFSDCCSDYEEVCYSCADRCGDEYIYSAPCHCNDECTSNNNCCDDYNDLCDGTSGGSVTDADILAISEELSGLDVNNVATEVVIDMQAMTSSGSSQDLSPDPLFVSVPELTADTYVLFEAVRDNYEHAESVAEDNTVSEQAEVAAFLDAVMTTPVMVRLEEFMTDHQLITGTLRENIEEIWFTLYSRSGSTLGSSGFEHSFVGELDGGDVGGFHNWVSFEIEEAAGNANYHGYIEYTDLGTSGYVYTDQFDWLGAEKSFGGYLIGTSPEFELAIYTLCFFARPNARCNVQTNGVQYFIQTYELYSGGLTLVGSAYPGV
ncbi:Somatomedin B domain [Trinorchestia longiramus]|nr:Somatomedin B domain [Trinorchestia longiramus]